MARPMGSPSNAEVAAGARRVVMQEIARRGGNAVEVRDGRRWELYGSGPDGTFRLRVVSRRRGDWQSSIRYSNGPGEFGRHWVFVDLGAVVPAFWILGEPDVLSGIRRRHDDYLARHGGHRPLNDESLHCKITTADVADGASRWDRLGLQCS